MNRDVWEQAAAWHAAQDGDDMDWPAFTAWLEADTRHRESFDTIALLDERIDVRRVALKAALAPDADASAPPARARIGIGRWGMAAGTAVAAGLAWLVVVPLVRPPADRPAPTVEYRALASSRALDLGRGARASLAQGSVLAAGTGRTMRLSLAGRALFDVAHDPARPLIVEAAGYRISDIGTRFEVVTGGGMVRVAVTQGRVAVRPPGGGTEVDLGAGQVLTGLADGRVALARRRADDVGRWRAGPLVYDQMPLGLVAAEVSRVSGQPVRVDPSLAGRSFSGVLVPARGDAMTDALASLAGLQARRRGDTVLLDARPSR